jgi:phosphoribosylanthranilate isomerase
MPVSIKICGLKEPLAIQAVIAAKADYAGFVHFQASPRHVELQHAKELASLLPESTRSVLVVVDPDDGLLEASQSVLQPDYIQLHGKETPARLQAIRKQFSSLKIIKAIRVRNADDVAGAMAFSPYADMLLFDAKPPEVANLLPGGNGLSFDWALLKGREFPLPWFLSGGLNTDNVAEAIQHTGATFIDVSSGVERAPGVKDPALIDAFVKAARSA